MRWVAPLFAPTLIALALLLSATSRGGAQSAGSVKLNAPLVAGGSVSDFRVSADGRWVVYRADQETDQVFEPYSVLADGGPVNALNAPLSPGSDVLDFRISGDITRVVFRVGPLVGGAHDLYSVPIAGGTPVRLNDDETSANTSSVITAALTHGCSANPWTDPRQASSTISWPTTRSRSARTAGTSPSRRARNSIGGG